MAQGTIFIAPGRVYLMPPFSLVFSIPLRHLELLDSCRQKLPIRVTGHLVSACLSNGSTLHRVHVDKLPRSQNRCGKQNGELSFLGHAGTPAFWDDVQAGNRGTAVYFFLSHKSMKSFTVDLKTAWLENQARLSFFSTFGPCNPI